MTGTDIQYAAKLLQEEKVVAIPTETVYGLAGNALSSKAVAEIFAVKQRPSFDPLIVHTSGIERINGLVTNFPPLAAVLARHFMPGPLTLLLPKSDIIPDLVTSGSPYVAIRVPAHPVAQQLLDSLPFPLAAPSANPFGYISPTTPEHVEQQLGDKIPYILDGGPCTVGVESTIFGYDEEGIPTIFRKGGLAIEDIQQLIGPVQIREHSSSNPKAPGMLKSHYAPRVPFFLELTEALKEKYTAADIGFLRFREKRTDMPDSKQYVLSRKGDYREAARRLFAGMRTLDNQNLKCIIAELLPEENLGRAINDRLRRAAVPPGSV